MAPVTPNLPPSPREELSEAAEAVGSQGGPPPPSPTVRTAGGASTYEGAYSGDYAGVTWNTQGLWHTRRRRRKPKFDHLRRIARGVDFVILTDTHSS